MRPLLQAAAPPHLHPQLLLPQTVNPHDSCHQTPDKLSTAMISTWIGAEAPPATDVAVPSKSCCCRPGWWSCDVAASAVPTPTLSLQQPERRGSHELYRYVEMPLSSESAFTSDDVRPPFERRQVDPSEPTALTRIMP